MPAARIADLHARRPARTTFAAVFAAAWLCFLAIGATLPVLPRFVHGELDAGDLAVGVVIGAFAFSAVVARPVAGRLADERGRRRVLVGGATLAAIGGLLLFVPAGVAGLIVARLVLGIGDGFLFVAGAAWTVDLAPEDRRGRAIGLFGLAIWGGLSVGPAIGEGLLALGGYDLVWAASAAMPALGALLAMRIPEARTPAPPRERAPLFAREALGPGAALTLANFGYAAVAAFVVLHLADRGVSGGAAVFTSFAVAVVVTRLVAGGLPDRVGGARTAAGAGLAEAAGLVILGAAQSLPAAIAGALVMGAGFSLLFPALALLVVERTDESRRGAALGTFTACFDVGVGLGAPLAGVIAALAGYPSAFYAAAGFALLGVGATAVRSQRAASLRPA